MIELENFSKKYNKNKDFSVENVSFCVEKGKILGLLGPNGSGKTTIIKAICGFHFPSSGKIYISDNKNTKIEVSEKPEQVMSLTGYVPEISLLPQESYVYNFLKYAALSHNIKAENVEDAVKKVCKECSIEAVLTKKIKALSKGFQQRVSFAQALIYSPQNLILDEPVSGLDPNQIIQMRNLIKKLSSSMSILISTHILQEVNSLCDQVCIINKGKLVEKGTEQEILQRTNCPDFEKAFIKLTQEEEI